ncbi:MAG: hypothetical protein B7Z15_10490 [Rhizobiales bacterium 32-66-8]|nr:MAG: hypothetical protein B7Z15_10490 [Rhizobiales bacterium 32-66-8]
MDWARIAVASEPLVSMLPVPLKVTRPPSPPLPPPPPSATARKAPELAPTPPLPPPPPMDCSNTP